MTAIPTKLLVCCAAALTLWACDDGAAVGFQAQTIAAGSATDHALNEPIAIRFSAAPDPSSVTPEAIRVISADGRRLSTTVRVHDDTVLVEPANPDGWPASSKLLVQIPHPWIGRPIASTTGKVNTAPFQCEVQTSTTFAPRGGALRLVAGHELNGASQVTRDAEFWFEFDGVIDPASLHGGVELTDVTHGEACPSIEARVRARRGISIAPFANEPFRENTVYRLVLSHALRARDGRRLAADLTFTFSTTDSPSGEHTTDFRPDHLADPSQKPDPGPLRPRLRSPEFLPLTLAETDAIGAPFGREPGRVQILVPAELLGGTEKDALINALVFKVQGFDPAVFDSLSVRMGYAAPTHQDDLSANFDENWNLPMPRGGRDIVGGQGRRAILDPGKEGKLVIEFSEPFLYERALGLPVLVEITSDAGLVTPDATGFALLGEQRDETPAKARFVQRTGNWLRTGERSGFVPALTVVVQHDQPILLRPWKTTTVDDPEYFDRPDHLEATGREFFDFRIEYRALQSADSSASGNERDWTIDLSRLRGQRIIQARVVFPLKAKSNNREENPEVEIRRLTVPFRETRSVR